MHLRNSRAFLQRFRIERAACVAALFVVGCSKKLEGPAPALASKSKLPVAPAIICGDQLTTTLDLNGARLTPVPVNVPNKPELALPSLTLTRSAALDGTSADPVKVLYGGDPTKPENSTALRWLDPTHMQFTIDQALSIDGQTGRVPSGIYDAHVMNPNGDQAIGKAVLAVVDKPALTDIAPALLCLSQGEREVTLSGSGLLRIADARPQLQVDGADNVLDVSELADCSMVAQKNADAESCATGRLTLAKDALDPGLHDLVLNNPESAACHTEETLKLRVVAAPTIDMVTPGALCTLDKQQTLKIQGDGFLDLGGELPVVKLAGQTLPVSRLSSCEDLQTPGLNVRSCKQIELDVDIGALGTGDIQVDVENAQPAGCAVSATAVLRIVEPPQIRKVSPTNLCSANMTTFTVTGRRFDKTATASVDDVAADVQFVSSTELKVIAPGLDAGKHAFTVTNGGRCVATLPAVLQVEPSPIVFYADPPVLYGQVPVEVTVFTSGLASNATKVELQRQGSGDSKSLTFTSPTRPNQILAQVPSGLSPGSWDVVVTNAGGCSGTLSGGVMITNQTDDALVSSIKPSYASTTEDTAVTISGAGLAPVPRVYLTTPSTSGTASALRAVEVKSGGQTVTAVIPSGLSPGTYDLFVVNPDGKVDVLTDGVTIVADAPPVVTSVTPASLPSNASNVQLTITGTGFKPNLGVVLDCLTTGGQRTTVATTAQAPNGSGTSVVANVTMGNATPAPVDAGSVCLVRLTNADGAFFEYSAFSVTNSSLNLSPWKSAPGLQTARRALSLLAGRPTATSRYLYAIGGDEGAASPTARGANVFDSIESSQVDVFGTMSAWTTQRQRLAAPRTAAGAASIGRFVYLLGGHDGTSATQSVQRAAILDPLAVPQITDVVAALSDGTKGLGEGLYYYRVSAVMVDSDAANPAGETLAGELLPVQLPARQERITVLLSWQSVVGAHGYRIYGSPKPNTSASSLELLGEISCGSPDNACDCTKDPTRCRFLDEGGGTTAGQTPLPAGSLGRWHDVSGARCSGTDCSLKSAREGLVVAAVKDPADSSHVYLYAFGGRDDTGAYLNHYELATVTIAADGAQTVSDFAVGTETFASPRADHGVWVMNKYNSSVIANSATPNDVWVYVGGGRTTGGSVVRTVQAAKLGASGQLSAFSAVDSLKGDLVGFGTGASNNQLYTFGGLSTADGSSAALASSPPALASGAFNSLGPATTQRMFCGYTQESAFFFVVGGHDGVNVLKTAESTVQ